MHPFVLIRAVELNYLNRPYIIYFNPLHDLSQVFVKNVTTHKIAHKLLQQVECVVSYRLRIATVVAYTHFYSASI